MRTRLTRPTSAVSVLVMMSVSQLAAAHALLNGGASLDDLMHERRLHPGFPFCPPESGPFYTEILSEQKLP